MNVNSLLHAFLGDLVAAKGPRTKPKWWLSKKHLQIHTQLLLAELQAKIHPQESRKSWEIRFIIYFLIPGGLMTAS